MKKETLGDRMKKYEKASSISISPRSYLIVRVDQKKASRYTKRLQKPFDSNYSNDMIETAKYLCANLQGAKLAYTQSDEISILFTDFDTIKTQQLYDGRTDKINSVTSSLTTSAFNNLRLARVIGSEDFDLSKFVWANFDARTFIIPHPNDVMNYFLWRQRDCTRNSVSMAGQAHFSHKQLQGKNGSEIQDMLMLEKGINWNDYEVRFKRGTVIAKVSYEKAPGAIRTKWSAMEPPIFSKDWGFLSSLVPLYENDLFQLEE